MISEAAPFEAQVGKLVKTIQANNPKAKISVLQRPRGSRMVSSVDAAG